MKTIISKDIEFASFILKKGGVILFPTETVWGLGANSHNNEACKKIYQLKNRPVDNPLIVHVKNFETLNQIAFLKNEYFDLVKNFSPGPISYVLNKKDQTIFSTNLDTIGVRIPSSKEFLSILEFSNIPISAPSANISGKPSITTLAHAIEEFENKVEFIYEGETSEVGLESTVISLFEKPEQILRPGKITFEDLKIYLPEIVNTMESEKKVLSPGTKYRHYSPNGKVGFWKNFSGENYSYIGFTKKENAKYQIILKDNLDYMKNLYSFFIESDKLGIQDIFCEYPREDKYKDSILNRIEKAISK